LRRATSDTPGDSVPERRFAVSENAEKAFAVWKQDEGVEEGAGDWMEVTQERINQFADVTEDHQFIHVDPEAAKATPFGTTLAHGFLTLSLLTRLSASVPMGNPERFEGMMMGVNYGFDTVRFVSPVKVGSRIRVRAVLAKVELKGNAIQSTRTMTIEIEGEQRPAMVADWLTRVMYS
jgi:acyl dehydratase